MRGYAHVIKEDAVEPDLLFLGTEFGLWISLDGGATWARVQGRRLPERRGARPPGPAARQRPRPRDARPRHLDRRRPHAAARARRRTRSRSDAAFLPGRPVQQRMPAQRRLGRGRRDVRRARTRRAAPSSPTTSGRATSSGRSSSRSSTPRASSSTRSPPTKRRGINRVVWSMQVKPPRVPRAAQLAFGASQGPRVLPGTYTVRLTKGGEVDRDEARDRPRSPRALHAPPTARRSSTPSMKAHALFGEMSALVDRIDAARAAAANARRRCPPATRWREAPRRADKLDAIKKKIVATKEGGAITGEERIREHLDTLYGALERLGGQARARTRSSASTSLRARARRRREGVRGGDGRHPEKVNGRC